MRSVHWYEFPPCKYPMLDCQRKLVLRAAHLASELTTAEVFTRGSLTSLLSPRPALLLCETLIWWWLLALFHPAGFCSLRARFRVKYLSDLCLNSFRVEHLLPLWIRHLWLLGFHEIRLYLKAMSLSLSSAQRQTRFGCLSKVS